MKSQTVIAIAIATGVMLAIAAWVFGPLFAALKTGDASRADIDAVIASMDSTHSIEVRNGEYSISLPERKVLCPAHAYALDALSGELKEMMHEASYKP